MAFVSDFSFLFGLPHNSLMIIAWGDEICRIKMINVKDFIVMLIESFH